MTFAQLAKEMGVESFPEELEAFHRRVKALPALLTEELLLSLQAKYNLFGTRAPAVYEAWKKWNENPNKRAYFHTLSYYVKEGSLAQARKIPVPPVDPSEPTNLFLLFLLLPMVEDSLEKCRSRGFSEDEISASTTVYLSNVERTTARSGRLGLSKGLYDWCCLYAKALIFRCGGFVFNLSEHHSKSYVLRHKKTKQTIFLMHDMPVHASGIPLGSAGYEDEKDSFVAMMEESEDSFFGYPSLGATISKERQQFPKKDYELILSPKDCILGMHIPAKADLGKERVEEALAMAMELARLRYPENDPKAIRCHSWLLNPRLEEILGPDANIPRFGALFSRYPVKDAGKSVFSFVFPKEPQDFRELPENTRLQKALKELYLQGESLHNYYGYIFL